MLIIGDVHSKVNFYWKLIQGIDESIQVGDFGFAEQHEWHIANCDSTKHKIVFGNHDDYAYLNRVHSLGNWSWNANYDLFTIRGAKSIDRMHRIEGVSWWKEEELNWTESNEVIDNYSTIKPRIVISHDCPESISMHWFGHSGSFTRVLLQNLLEIHTPELWIFGHHHRNKNDMINGTRFICLGELQTFTI